MKAHYTMTSQVTLYTDGACSGNPGPGGWACVLLYNELRRRISGYEQYTTNNKMELTGVIKGLESLTRPMPVLIITDSQYVKNGFTEKWLENWQKNGWKTKSGKPVKNIELWMQLSLLQRKHHLSWQWVKGHSGNEYNDMCDELARNAIIKKNGIDEKF
ncbi:ribonuclease HI [Pigmentibacter sp. JX0631]|uniref:ribonuclease HI n=1 Tax=Pigmentibacter sp. JX0631 TaxID=2976982 RepID=UPI0024695B52|nr:ribonuclease HI [Pigmentibacter sp. JX0631]WGL58486.1 ribonuclease HI [Pigmentibacter sp. JX0631]